MGCMHCESDRMSAQQVAAELGMIRFCARNYWPQRGPVEVQYLGATEGVGREEASALVALGLVTEEEDGRVLRLTDAGIAMRDCRHVSPPEAE